MEKKSYIKVNRVLWKKEPCSQHGQEAYMRIDNNTASSSPGVPCCNRRCVCPKQKIHPLIWNSTQWPSYVSEYRGIQLLNDTGQDESQQGIGILVLRCLFTVIEIRLQSILCVPCSVLSGMQFLSIWHEEFPLITVLFILKLAGLCCEIPANRTQFFWLQSVQHATCNGKI